MKTLSVPGAVYGKPIGQSPAPVAYREIIVSPAFPVTAVERWRQLYRSFAWRPLAGGGRQADVFAGIMLADNSALLCRFRDMGRDSQNRPHTVRAEGAWLAPEHAVSAGREYAAAEAWGDVSEAGLFDLKVTREFALGDVAKFWVDGDRSTFRFDPPEVSSGTGVPPVSTSPRPSAGSIVPHRNETNRVFAQPERQCSNNLVWYRAAVAALAFITVVSVVHSIFVHRDLDELRVQFNDETGKKRQIGIELQSLKSKKLQIEGELQSLRSEREKREQDKEATQLAHEKKVQELEKTNGNLVNNNKDLKEQIERIKKEKPAMPVSNK